MEKLRVLIDTTFLLPTLGVRVEKEAMETIPLFRKIKVFYIEAGVLEALWKVLKVLVRDKVKVVEDGLEAIRRTYHLVTPSYKSYVDAIRIYDLGHRDFIDALHYCTAINHKLYFLTIDYPFINFLKQQGYRVDNVVLTPREFRNLVS